MPPKFNREDLKYSYDWSKEYREKSYVDPDDFIDRNNGHQMLVFFNRFLKLHGLFTATSLHRLEKLFCKYMPKEITNRAEIMNWLGQNWNKHFH